MPLMGNVVTIVNETDVMLCCVQGKRSTLGTSKHFLDNCCTEGQINEDSDEVAQGKDESSALVYANTAC